ncbi:unnamed protein product, partial [Ectocarpus sp. 8 AP-2014]
MLAVCAPAARSRRCWEVFCQPLVVSYTSLGGEEGVLRLLHTNAFLSVRMRGREIVQPRAVDPCLFVIFNRGRWSALAFFMDLWMRHFGPRIVLCRVSEQRVDGRLRHASALGNKGD